MQLTPVGVRTGMLPTGGNCYATELESQITGETMSSEISAGK